MDKEIFRNVVEGLIFNKTLNSLTVRKAYGPEESHLAVQKPLFDT